MDSFLLEGLSHVIARAIDVSGDDYMQVLELVLEIFETTLADGLLFCIIYEMFVLHLV